MVEENTGLVGHYLRLIRCPPTEWEDAFQDGVVGLMRASQKYEPERWFRFSTYAMNWIKQGVQRGRARAEGLSRRRAEDPRPHLSLDAPIESSRTREWTLHDKVADQRIELDTEVITGIEADTTLRLAYDACLDDMDRAIVDNFAAASPLTLAALAASLHVGPDTIRRRRRRIRLVLREQLENAA